MTMPEAGTRDHFQWEINLAKDRLSMFASGTMGTADIDPPKDTTRESMEAERRRIAHFEAAIAYLRR